MKKRKLKVFNLLIVILGVILVGFLSFKLIKLGIDFFTEQPAPPVKPDVVEKFSMDLVDYEVYDIEDVDFNFALVRFKISDKDGVYYSLGDLYTDENIKCNNIDSFVNKLEAKSYYLGSKNVDFEIESKNKSGIFKIFVPIKDKSKTNITLSDVVSKKEFKIDLSKNHADPETLKYSTGNSIENKGYKLSINDAYIETKVMTNEGLYSYPSTVQIYTFAINIEEVSETGLKIDDAVFEMESGESFNATPNIYSKKLNNAIGSTIREGDKLGLFFEVSNPNSDSKSFAGKLKIKFSNNNEWLIIETELN